MIDCFNGRLQGMVKTAILVEGARRVGKSTLVKQFAQKSMNHTSL